MAIRLPRLRREIPIVESNQGPSLAFQQWLDIAFKQIEASVSNIQLALTAAGIALNQIGQPVSVATTTVTSDYTAVLEDYLILADCTAGAVTITLPACADSEGTSFVVKKTDVSVNVVTVDADSSETIDGATTQALASQYDSVTIVCDGTSWWII